MHLTLMQSHSPRTHNPAVIFQTVWVLGLPLQNAHDTYVQLRVPQTNKRPQMLKVKQNSMLAKPYAHSTLGSRRSREDHFIGGHHCG